MAKKIRLPLIMDGDIAVNSVSELREHFSILKMLEYVSDDKEKLLTWLRDRYEEEIAEKIEALDANDGELAKKLHEIFGVEFTEQNDITLDDVKEAKEKRGKLSQFTQNEDLLCHAADCAFEQNDVYDLLDAGKTKIYLCGEKFEIPISKKGVEYIGIKINEKEPIAVIDSNEKIDFATRDISFEGIIFDEKYLEVCNSIEVKIDNSFTSSKSVGEITEMEIPDVFITMPGTGEKTLFRMVDVVVNTEEKDGLKPFAISVMPINNSIKNEIIDFMKKSDLFSLQKMNFELQLQQHSLVSNFWRGGEVVYRAESLLISNLFTLKLFGKENVVYSDSGIDFSKKGFRLPTEAEWKYAKNTMERKKSALENPIKGFGDYEICHQSYVYDNNVYLKASARKAYAPGYCAIRLCRTL